MNGLLVSVIINISVMIAGVFSTNFLILKNVSKDFILPPFVIMILVLSIFSFISGILVSFYSSKTNCKTTNKTKAFKEGGRHIIYALIAYLIVYFVSFIREPFLEILGKGPLGYSCAQAFMISLNTTTATIINYYGTIKASCKVPQEKIEHNLRKLDKYLDKKPVKKEKLEITIKD